MIRRSLLLATCAVIVAALPAAARAQDTSSVRDTLRTRDTTRTQDSTRRGDTAQVRDTITAGGDVAAAPTFATLMTALSGTHGTAEKLRSLPATLQATDVRIVDVNTLVTPQNEAEFYEAFERHRAERDSLHAALQQHQTLSQALAQHQSQPMATDVVAVDVTPNGEVVLYVRKPKKA